MNKEIKCKKCGWSWKESESDDKDLYLCHKCHFDNTPLNETRQFIKKKLREGIESNPIPKVVYHGGDCSNISLLAKKFVILSPQDKMQFPSTGAGKVGLSTSVDKSIAKKYSQVFGCDNVLSIMVSPKAKFHFVENNGQGIDDIFSNDQIEELTNRGYDAIIEVDDGAEKEVRILNTKAFKVNRIER